MLETLFLFIAGLALLTMLALYAIAAVRGGRPSLRPGAVVVVLAILAALPAGARLKNVTGHNLPFNVASHQIVADYDNTEQATDINLPTTAIVWFACVHVTTADASQTIDVGTNGSGSNDPDGFLDGVSVNATGVFCGSLASGAQTLGALLRVDEDGAGVLVPRPDVTSGGENVTFTGSDTTNTARGLIYVFYSNLN